MEAFALRGNFIWTEGPDRLCLRPDSFAVCGEDGLCAGVFDALPERYASVPVRDLGNMLVVPGYADMHLHAGQYADLGLGMDLQLIQWLDDLTYPEEARFADPAYAARIYGAFTEELRAGLTTRAAIFATAHTEGTLLLMDALEKSGLVTYVGRVNMDRSAPDYIREPDAQRALADTRDWAARAAGYKNTRPILTPRFVPSCTPELMAGLGRLRGELGLPVQSHLDETPEEVAWVGQLCPESASYAAVYDENGLLGPDTLMAHCIYMTEAECALVKERGAFVVHCPGSNTNVRSGIAPIRKYMDMGLRVCLGTDISGGNSLDMAQAVRDAMGVSRLLWRLDEGHPAHLKAREAFHLATEGGGAYFGKVGAFRPGYEFDAVAVDDAAWRTERDDMAARFEKLIYRAGSGDVRAKYVAGRRLF